MGKSIPDALRHCLAAALFVSAALCVPLHAAEFAMTGVTADPQDTQCKLYGEYTVCWTLSVSGEIEKGDPRRADARASEPSCSIPRAEICPKRWCWVAPFAST